MKVRALCDIPAKRGTITAGTVFNAPDSVIHKLAGKVEPVKLTPDDACRQIGAHIEELDATGPWPQDLCAILAEVAPEAFQKIQAANRAVDHAADVLKDPEALDAALIEYAAAWRAGLSIVGPPVYHKQAPQAETCRRCGSTDIWQGRSKRVCRVCHPPAPGAEI